ncbi:uncharacterized protein LOC121085655 [Falco naumanni]|uniref:uncharacterized protein LOC121085655 n=1 Tax=Falco naumanni TaxID=148594 RepID=UPI001ADEBB30|nr:uncharacterized protein LOC121085655 [Falco naumanni]
MPASSKIASAMKKTLGQSTQTLTVTHRSCSIKTDTAAVPSERCSDVQFTPGRYQEPRSCSSGFRAVTGQDPSTPVCKAGLHFCALLEWGPGSCRARQSHRGRVLLWAVAMGPSATSAHWMSPSACTGRAAGTAQGLQAGGLPSAGHGGAAAECTSAMDPALPPSPTRCIPSAGSPRLCQLLPPGVAAPASATTSPSSRLCTSVPVGSKGCWVRHGIGGMACWHSGITCWHGSITCWPPGCTRRLPGLPRHTARPAEPGSRCSVAGRVGRGCWLSGGGCVCFPSGRGTTEKPSSNAPVTSRRTNKPYDCLENRQRD